MHSCNRAIFIALGTNQQRRLHFEKEIRQAYSLLRVYVMLSTVLLCLTAPFQKASSSFLWWITDRLPIVFKLYAIAQRNTCLRVYGSVYPLFYYLKLKPSLLYKQGWKAINELKQKRIVHLYFNLSNSHALLCSSVVWSILCNMYRNKIIRFRILMHPGHTVRYNNILHFFIHHLLHKLKNRKLYNDHHYRKRSDRST